MTLRVVRRKRAETVAQKYNRLNRRIVRRLPVTAAETAFVWREKSRSIEAEEEPMPYCGMSMDRRAARRRQRKLLRHTEALRIKMAQDLTEEEFAQRLREAGWPEAEIQAELKRIREDDESGGTYARSQRQNLCAGNAPV
jgi:hypothetical protein